MSWSTEVPKMVGYYPAVPRHPDTWLDGTPEIVYLTFNGKWGVYRPGDIRRCPVEEFIRWGDRIPVENFEGDRDV